MSQYKSLMIKSSNSQFNRLKSGIKNGTEVTLNLLRKVTMIRLVIIGWQTRLEA